MTFSQLIDISIGTTYKKPKNWASSPKLASNQSYRRSKYYNANFQYLYSYDRVGIISNNNGSTEMFSLEYS